MANEKQTKAAAKSKTEGQLYTIADYTIAACVKAANELHVTGDQFKGIYPMQTGFVLVYYR